MKNNYPIKYAVVPMIEQIGWTAGIHDLEREYGIVYFIVTKCFLTDETKKYCQNGSTETKYHVVCPFEHKEYDLWKKCEPSYNLIDGHCTNSIVTSSIFDNYEEATQYKKEKNKKILEKKLAYLPYNEDYKQRRSDIIEEFYSAAEYYDKLEKMIEKKTPELRVNHDAKDQTVFVSQNGSLKHYADSLYYIMKLYDNKDFIVYSVNDAQFKGLKAGDFGNVNSCFPLIIYDSKAKVMRLMNPGNPDKFINDGVIRENYFGTLRRPDSNCIRLYTLETYQDIIDSYQISNLDVNTIQLVRKK